MTKPVLPVLAATGRCREVSNLGRQAATAYVVKRRYQLPDLPGLASADPAAELKVMARADGENQK